MRNYFIFITILAVTGVMLSGCGMANKTASEITPMIVIDGGSGLYNGNELIGKLPAGTEVNMIEK